MWTWENTEPFGNNAPNETISGSTFKFNLRLPGQYFDNESNLSYNYFRDYNFMLGRYIQSGPIGLRGGINTYRYVKGNTLGYIDLAGLDSIHYRLIRDYYSIFKSISFAFEGWLK